jgi:hypothetical protein
MRNYLLAHSGSWALSAAFMSETCEVILAQSKGGKTVRVNKADFEADQELPAKERAYKPYEGRDEPAQSEPATAGLIDTSDGPPLAAPSAPHFGGEDAPAPAPVDPLKGAVAPTTGTADQRLVMKRGKKYFVVDAKGENITGDGIEKDGYTTEDAAWKAIKDLPH